MLNSDQTILEMYETLGLSLDQIASETGYDLEAIKLSLLQNSVQFAKAARQFINAPAPPPTENSDIAYPIFNQADETLAKETLREICKYGELEICRTSAAKTILKLNAEERASKRATLIGRTTFNINVIQANLDRARRAVEMSNTKTIDIPPKLEENVA